MRSISWIALTISIFQPTICPGQAADTTGCGALHGDTVVQRLARNGDFLKRFARTNLAGVKARSFLISRKSPRKVAVTLSWGGPSGGAIALVNCQATPIALLNTGYIETAHVLHLSGNGPSELMVHRITGTGTGWIRKDASVIGFQGDSVAVLWTGVIHERSYQTADVGAYEINGSVRLIGSDTLLYQSTRTPLNYEKTTRHWVPAEGEGKKKRQRFVWSSKEKRFRPTPQ
jgi:hypothetical protein